VTITRAGAHALQGRAVLTADERSNHAQSVFTCG
jgi:hypothetical protein